MDCVSSCFRHRLYDNFFYSSFENFLSQSSNYLSGNFNKTIKERNIFRSNSRSQLTVSRCFVVNEVFHQCATRGAWQPRSHHFHPPPSSPPTFTPEAAINRNLWRCRNHHDLDIVIVVSAIPGGGGSL